MNFRIDMDDDSEIILLEAETYPMSSLIADTGGAAGLFLGLSVIGSGS